MVLIITATGAQSGINLPNSAYTVQTMPVSTTGNMQMNQTFLVIRALISYMKFKHNNDLQNSPTNFATVIFDMLAK